MNTLSRRSFLLAAASPLAAAARDWDIEIEQVTQGPNHHWFGYIGHARNTPWNGSDRYMALLRAPFQDRMPKAADEAEVVLVDMQRKDAVTPVERTRAWNFQQGTMFYWNPLAPDRELIFNDRDKETNHTFAVLFDVVRKRRIREFKFPYSPFANSGVAQQGGRFLGINYGRLARLRPVTGYPGAYDWNRETAAPDNDGIFLVDINAARQKLLVSFLTLADMMKKNGLDVSGRHLFINHTLWSRDDSRIYFFVRADFEAKDRVNVPCTIHPDGSGLTMHKQFIGGHPEWATGTRIIGDVDGKQVIYDVDAQKLVETIGGPDVFPHPGGDVSLSPDAKWFVNGYREGEENFYIVFRREDATFVRSRGFAHPGRTAGELRVDAAPCWNRASNQIAFPAIAGDGTRQTFRIRVAGKKL